mmetsp:Transcript_11198/g.36889  ORF Transcript_11198/g.36889 Transcript_11198/m.36889 type:complete len:143 (-) Transcript_11198:1098-1526(-)
MRTGRMSATGRNKPRRCLSTTISRMNKNWRAGIKINGQNYRLGSFENPVEAAHAWDAAAISAGRPREELNFPEDFAPAFLKDNNLGGPFSDALMTMAPDDAVDTQWSPTVVEIRNVLTDLNLEFEPSEALSAADTTGRAATA